MDLVLKLKTKLPSKAMSKVYICVFFNMFRGTFPITLMWPILPFMTDFLVPAVRENVAARGKYVGIISSAFFAGRVCASYFWGAFSDRRGRKQTLIISSVLASLSTLIFGFSTSFTMAVLLRFIGGLFAGNTLVSKAVASEASNDKNQGFAIGIVTAGWGFSYVLGPAVSGATVDLIGQYNLNITNNFLHDSLTRFPYSLPGIIDFLVGIIIALITFLLLPETLNKTRKKKEDEISKRQAAASSNSALMLTTGDVDSVQSSKKGSLENLGNGESSRDLAGEEGDSANGSSERQDSSPAEIRTEERDQGEQRTFEQDSSTAEIQTKEKEQRTTSWLSRKIHKLGRSLKRSLVDLKLILCDRVALLALLIYVIYGLADIGYSEALSLWVTTPSYLGGLGFDVREISLVLTISGILVLPLLITVFPIMERYFKLIRTFFIAGCILIFCIMLIPNLHYMLLAKNIPWLLWILLISMSTINLCFLNTMFSASVAFINNSVPFARLGAVNGIATLLVSIGRVFSPFVIDSLFSVSLSEATLSFGFPVDYHLVFFLFSLVYFIDVLLATCLPTSINNQKAKQ